MAFKLKEEETPHSYTEEGFDSEEESDEDISNKLKKGEDRTVREITVQGIGGN
jgi:hypothetical protein